MRSRSTVNTPRVPADARRELGRYFRRNGYVRRQNPRRLAQEGYLGYKKGDEVRLTAQDEQELHGIQELLMRAGFRPGRPFLKGRQYRLPIYGREAVRRFLQLVQNGGNVEHSGAHDPPPRASGRVRRVPRTLDS
jgi:hypothetical protein